MSDHVSMVGRDPLSGAKLSYPVDFELRVIYQQALADGLPEAITAILDRCKAAPQAARSLPAKGATYGRLAIGVRFQDEASMHAAYAAIGALPGVKALI